MAGNKILSWLSRYLLIAGGLELGVQNFFNYDLLGTILGGYAVWIYYAAGLAALYSIYCLYKYKEM